MDTTTTTETKMTQTDWEEMYNYRCKAYDKLEDELKTMKKILAYLVEQMEKSHIM